MSEPTPRPDIAAFQVMAKVMEAARSISPVAESSCQQIWQKQIDNIYVNILALCDYVEQCEREICSKWEALDSAVGALQMASEEIDMMEDQLTTARDDALEKIAQIAEIRREWQTLDLVEVIRSLKSKPKETQP